MASTGSSSGTAGSHMPSKDGWDTAWEHDECTYVRIAVLRLAAAARTTSSTSCRVFRSLTVCRGRPLERCAHMHVQLHAFADLSYSCTCLLVPFRFAVPPFSSMTPAQLHLFCDFAARQDERCQQRILREGLHKDLGFYQGLWCLQRGCFPDIKYQVVPPDGTTRQKRAARAANKRKRAASLAAACDSCCMCKQHCQQYHRNDSEDDLLVDLGLEDGGAEEVEWTATLEEAVKQFANSAAGFRDSARHHALMEPPVCAGADTAVDARVTWHVMSDFDVVRDNGLFRCHFNVRAYDAAGQCFVRAHCAIAFHLVACAWRLRQKKSRAVVCVWQIEVVTSDMKTCVLQCCAACHHNSNRELLSISQHARHTSYDGERLQHRRCFLWLKCAGGGATVIRG